MNENRNLVMDVSGNVRRHGQLVAGRHLPGFGLGPGR